MDVGQCSDGSFVSRDPANDCQFPCTICPGDIEICTDGSYVQRDPANECLFKECVRRGLRGFD